MLYHVLLITINSSTC